jgi:spoIIIJ-associated protein
MTDAQHPNLIEILQNLLRHIGLDVSVTKREEGNTLYLKVEGPDAENARGKKGEVLDALQYILGKVLGNAEQHEQKVLIDIGNFRANREDSIKEMGRFLLEKSLRRQTPIAIYPMSSADRRVVHAVINEDGRTSSQSEGDGMARRLFVIPGAKAPRAERPPRRADDHPLRRPEERSESRPPRDSRPPRHDRPAGDPNEARPPRRFEERGGQPPRDNRPPRDDQGGRPLPPRALRPQAGPPLGTPENPYIMEPPPETPEE